jgi:hypothetical protein
MEKIYILRTDGKGNVFYTLDMITPDRAKVIVKENSGERIVVHNGKTIHKEPFISDFQTSNK